MSENSDVQKTMELISQKGPTLSTAKKYQSRLGAGKVVAEYLPQLQDTRANKGFFEEDCEEQKGSGSPLMLRQKEKA